MKSPKLHLSSLMTILDPASKNVKLAQLVNVDLDRSQPWNLLPPRQLLR
jgi:hypothetical protein